MWKMTLQIMTAFMTTPNRCKHDSAAFNFTTRSQHLLTQKFTEMNDEIN